MKSEEKCKIIYEPIIERFLHVAMDKNGFLVVQECINSAQTEEWRKRLVQATFDNLQALINDEFGNFVVQTVLDYYGC